MSHGFDVPAYLKRIGYDGTLVPSLDTLDALAAAHLRSIAFENLTPLMGRPVYDLGADTLFDKMVHHARGGYCYEQNGLFGSVLAELGFEVAARSARVVWMSPDGLDGPPSAKTHQLLAVRIPGDQHRYLVDVGFGGQTPTSALRFVHDEVQQTRHEPYRLRGHGGEHVLETLIADQWRPIYVFADRPVPLIDLQVGSWYVSTHPESHFVTGLSVAMATDEARWNLGGRHLSVHHRDGRTDKTELRNASEVLGVLMNTFGLDVGGLGDVHKRITEVI
ncbi:arylamine N-acetyltransferase [Mycobacterium sp. MS1601]|uniref:arylamine N-acetyltransferase family protein n=1 Tax=Mycobacterium sp. MS1601 TaxID=1936029 RepID=UPI0009791448|nr:arylamine N-acetyltransferase [Mycobacterium sp. MS1601]AQA06433.1 arylamine N-acetyltransferase [Mycobacterium sp. MS1601]